MSGHVRTTRTQKMWLRPDGIIYLANTATAQEKDDAFENLRMAAEVGGPERRPVLIDCTVVARMSTETQMVYTDDSVSREFSAVALVLHDWFGRIMGNFFFARQNKALPLRLFSSEADAVKWLRSYVPQTTRQAS